MRVFLLLCALWASGLDAQLSGEWQQFQEFLVRYDKPYKNDLTAQTAKFRVFKESLERQQWLNWYEAKSRGSALYGVNKFSDLTPEEFKELYLSGLKLSEGSLENYSQVPLPHKSLSASIPQQFDWRDKGAVGKVRNQEKCGSCWAFAVVETVASRYAIQNSFNFVELSPQQLISCESVPGLEGCEGGLLEVAFNVLRKDNVTVVEESTYPFESGDGKSHTCKSNLPNKGIQLLSYMYYSTFPSKNAQSYNESDMLQWLYIHSPLTTSVNANAWQDYSGGIIQHHCSASSFDHAVQLVGYDLTGDLPYWIVRNTWGTDWGEDGYVRLKFGDNMCGLMDEVVYVSDTRGVDLTP